MSEVQTPTNVVAVLLRRRGRICLLKRSRRVGSDRGRWHCVTGFLSDGTTATQQAAQELFDETGIVMSDLEDFRAGATISLLDEHGHPWTVSTFTCEVRDRRLQLNWENDRYRWVSPKSLPRFDPVVWLYDVIRACD